MIKYNTVDSVEISVVHTEDMHYVLSVQFMLVYLAMIYSLNAEGWLFYVRYLIEKNIHIFCFVYIFLLLFASIFMRMQP